MTVSDARSIPRHLTAMVRGDLSRPMRTALADGLLNSGTSVLDYGCGRGGDVRHLLRQGLDCVGWDPVHAPDGQRRISQVVNIGYVVNVIEDAAERVDALKEAWALTAGVLVVSARLRAEAGGPLEGVSSYNDGLVTRLGTFQKYFDQQELRTWIEQTLGTGDVAAAAPGVFYVFRDTGARVGFQAARFRRSNAARPQGIRRGDMAEHRPLLEPLIAFLASRGRPPVPSELPDRGEAVGGVFGSLGRALRSAIATLDSAVLDQTREARTEDLLVYLALSRFEGRPRMHELPPDMQLDAKAFFGSYAGACKRADELLFSLGSAELREAACHGAPFGKLLPEALYVHIDGVAELPVELRLYEGCARGFLGTVPGATLVKLRRDDAKVSYLSYPRFDEDPHPALTESVSVDLRTFRVRQRDYGGQSNPPVLHRKELFVPATYPRRATFERLTRQEEAHGLFETTARIGTRDGWEQALAARGVATRGHRLVNRRPSNSVSEA